MPARQVSETDEEDDETSSSEPEKQESLYNPDFGVGRRSVARKDWSALMYTDDYCPGVDYFCLFDKCRMLMNCKCTGSDSEGEHDWKEGDKDDDDEEYVTAFFASL